MAFYFIRSNCDTQILHTENTGMVLHRKGKYIQWTHLNRQAFHGISLFTVPFVDGQ